MWGYRCDATVCPGGRDFKCAVGCSGVPTERIFNLIKKKIFNLIKEGYLIKKNI